MFFIYFSQNGNKPKSIIVAFAIGKYNQLFVEKKIITPFNIVNNAKGKAFK